MNNNEYAIEKTLKKLKEFDRQTLFLFTKELILFLTSNGIELLDTSVCKNVLELFEKFPDGNIPNEDYLTLIKLYRTFVLFDFLRGMTKKTAKLEKINKKIKAYLQQTEDISNIIQFLNSIVLINLINKTIPNKVQEEIDEYNFVEKLNVINNTLLSKLNLSDSNYSNYHYEYKNAMKLFELSEEEYDRLYDLVFLFK